MTKREMFEMIATVNADNAEIVDFCNHEIELLANRKSSKKGMTKVQKENEGVKASIVEALAGFEEGVTVSDLIKSSEGLSEYSNQKISALLRLLITEGKVEKTMSGKKAFFSLA